MEPDWKLLLMRILSCWGHIHDDWYEEYWHKFGVSKEEGKKLYVNADRLGDYAELQVEILDKKFRPLPGYSGNDCIPVNESGLRQQVKWKDKDALEKFDHPIRVQITWGGVRVEDPRLFALYLS